MSPGELKPLLTTLALPPALPLLLIFAGVWLGIRHGSARRYGWALVLAGAGALWWLSCHGTAVWLAQRIIPQVAALEPARVAGLGAAGVQAVVVLGGGALPSAAEYGRAQPSAATAARLRYGFFLARGSGLPLAFAGGVGWAAAGSNTATEASTAQDMAQAHGLALRWVDADSRDTAENAAQLKALMQSPDGSRAPGTVSIALVTHAWHMPRSQRLFEQAGFTVLPAPLGFVVPQERPLLQWLPSAHGLSASRQVLREWLALRLS